jgi:outer membrane protein assembly factor BamA
LTQGIDIYMRGASNDGFHSGEAFGDFGWIEGEADIRAYIPLGGPNTSLALRGEHLFKSPKGGSQIPFYDLSFLGGHDFVRGYDAYRFRGNNVLIYAAEVRRTVRRVSVYRGWDVFGFADTGRVWGDSRSLDNPIVLLNQQFSLSPWRTGVGAGVEYRRSSGFAVRAELSHSKEGNPIYLLFSRGF